MDRKRSLVILGMAASTLVLILFVVSVGWGELVATLLSSHRGYLLLGTFTGLLAVLGMAMTMGVGISAAGVDVPPRKLSRVFLTSMFANSVTPFGLAGGEPFTAYLFSKEVDMPYERAYGTILAIDMMMVASILSLSLIGIIVYTLTFPLSVLGRFIYVALVVFTLVIGTVIFLLWMLFDARWEGGDHLLALLERIPGPSDRLLEYVEAHEEAIHERVALLRETVRSVFSDRRDLYWLVFGGHTAWLLLVMSLFFFLRAVGTDPSFVTVLLVLPLSSFSSYLPLPGGAGGAEVFLTVLILVFSNVSAPVAAGAALLYRFVTFIVPTIIGGVVATSISLEQYSREAPDI